MTKRHIFARLNLTLNPIGTHLKIIMTNKDFISYDIH